MSDILDLAPEMFAKASVKHGLIGQAHLEFATIFRRAEALPQNKKSPSGSISRPLADFHELRQGFIPPNLAEKIQMRSPYLKDKETKI